VVELGLAAGGELNMVYFDFDQKRLTVPINSSTADQLFAAFTTLGKAAADIRRVSHHQSRRPSRSGRSRSLLR
jgi:hypothetical protein